MTEPSLKTAALPQVGQTAPDFELPDSTGAMRRLSELTASGPLVLLFYRGHW
jgi:peroxiredoxin